MDLLITAVISVALSVAAVRYIWGAPPDLNADGVTKEQWMEAEFNKTPGTRNPHGKPMPHWFGN